MKRKQLNFADHQKNAIRETEVLCIFTSFVSYAAPLCYGVFLLNKYEPVHNLIKDWLEVELLVDWRGMTWICVFVWAAMAGANVAFDIIILLLLHIWLTIVCLESLTPISATSQFYRKNQKQGQLAYTFQTSSFGLMDDQQILHFYRTQEILSGLINEIYGSILFASHHVVVMVVLIGLSFLLINSPEIIWGRD